MYRVVNYVQETVLSTLCIMHVCTLCMYNCIKITQKLYEVSTTAFSILQIRKQDRGRLSDLPTDYQTGRGRARIQIHIVWLRACAQSHYTILSLSGKYSCA